jgi:hypothetical protein
MPTFTRDQCEMLNIWSYYEFEGVFTRAGEIERLVQFNQWVHDNTSFGNITEMDINNG